MKVIEAKHEILTPLDGDAILKHIERCGRLCYKSEDKITEDSAKKFIKMIRNLGHGSVLEHYNLTVLFYTDRGVTHEQVRHRIASYSQESTRYCNYNKDKFGNEITVVSIDKALRLDPVTKKLHNHQLNKILGIWLQAMEAAEGYYFDMLEAGASPQIARGVLPNSLKTEIAVTTNLREWRHILDIRTGSAAHPQIRELLIPLLVDLQQLIPVVFDDLEVPEDFKSL